MSELNALFNSLSTELIAHPTLLDSVIAVVSAFVFGQVLAWVYERTYRGLSYSTSMTHIIILGSVSAAIIILAMKHSVVAGLGLMAALSMIRFRTTLKDPKDLVYVMAGITLGIACGANALVPSVVGCSAFVVVSIYLDADPLGSRATFDGVLRFRVPPSEDLGARLDDLLSKYCRRFVLLNIGEVAQGDWIEHAYQVKLKRGADRNDLIQRLHHEFTSPDARLLLQEATLEY